MAINGVDNTQAYSKPKRVAKAITGTVATAAIVTAGLALGARKGKFAVTEESSAVAKKVLPYLDKAGKFINQKASQVAAKIVESQAYKKVATKLQESGVTDAIKEGFKKGQDITDDVAGKVKTADIKGKFHTAKEGVKDFFGNLVEKFTNPEKFNVVKATAEDLAEETFNGFKK